MDNKRLNVKQIKNLIIFAKEQGAIKVSISPDGALELEFQGSTDWLADVASETPMSESIDDDLLYFSSTGGVQ